MLSVMQRLTPSWCFEALLDDIERRLTADVRREPLFTLRWRLVIC